MGDRGVAVPYVAWTFSAAVGSTVLGVITPSMPSLALTYAAPGLLSVLINRWMGPAMAGLHLRLRSCRPLQGRWRPMCLRAAGVIS